MHERVYAYARVYGRVRVYENMTFLHVSVVLIIPHITQACRISLKAANEGDKGWGGGSMRRDWTKATGALDSQQGQTNGMIPSCCLTTTENG